MRCCLLIFDQAHDAVAIYISRRFFLVIININDARKFAVSVASL